MLEVNQWYSVKSCSVCDCTIVFGNVVSAAASFAKVRQLNFIFLHAIYCCNFHYKVKCFSQHLWQMCGGHCKDCKGYHFWPPLCTLILCICVLKIIFCACKSRRDILREIAQLTIPFHFLYMEEMKCNLIQMRSNTACFRYLFIQRPLREKKKCKLAMEEYNVQSKELFMLSSGFWKWLKIIFL